MRILVATVTAGGGHLQAAAALDEAWRAAFPKDDVKLVDLLDLVPKLQRKVIAEGYVKLVADSPVRGLEARTVGQLHLLTLS